MTPTQPVLLDLFSGGGGAAKGYMDAGFVVIGIDSEDHCRAAGRIGFEFHRMGLREGLEKFADQVDAVHASPPCQRYSRASACWPGLAARYPDLVGPVREALEACGRPFVIENVEGAPLHDPVMLCGSMVGLTATMPAHGKLGLRRHRLFEPGGGLLLAPPQTQCDHILTAIRVFGHGRPGNSDLRGPGYAAACREAMGIWWMSRDELNEAIPPAYAYWVGVQLILHLKGSRRGTADD
jgi:DNA (cytosine-5)-methyltransferase 1